MAIASSTSPGPTCTSSATAHRCGSASHWPTSAPTSSRCPIVPTSSPTGRRTTRRAGASASPTTTCSGSQDGDYEVCVDTSLEPGSLTYGEVLIPGSSDEEVLLSTHVCHPSLANDNLSGIAVLTALGRLLRARPLRYSYRLLFIPGTIGSIVWLSRNEDNVGRIRHGLVLTGIGDAAPFTYKKSRRGDADIDRAVQHVLRTTHDDAGRRLLTVRLRRAPVLLTGIQPSGRPAGSVGAR